MNSEYDYSGFNLASKIQPGEKIIHIGYDHELFNSVIPNFLHVDDLESYAQYNPAVKFNVAFCLEYINFGSVDVIENQIKLLVRLLREQDSRIYWRCNPGVQDYVDTQDIYAWTFDEHARLANKFKYEVVFQDWDNRQRIYAEWHSLKHSAHYFQSE